MPPARGLSRSGLSLRRWPPRARLVVDMFWDFRCVVSECSMYIYIYTYTYVYIYTVFSYVHTHIHIQKRRVEPQARLEIQNVKPKAHGLRFD